MMKRILPWAVAGLSAVLTCSNCTTLDKLDSGIFNKYNSFNPYKFTNHSESFARGKDKSSYTTLAIYFPQISSVCTKDFDSTTSGIYKKITDSNLNGNIEPDECSEKTESFTCFDYIYFIQAFSDKTDKARVVVSDETNERIYSDFIADINPTDNAVLHSFCILIPEKYLIRVYRGSDISSENLSGEYKFNAIPKAKTDETKK